jgi:hypothetical protein
MAKGIIEHLLAGGSEDGFGEDCLDTPDPTASRVGSLERILVYRERVASGQSVFCDADCLEHEPIGNGTQGRKAKAFARFPYRPHSKRLS